MIVKLKIILVLMASVFLLVVFSPIVFTDKETYNVILDLYKDYKPLYEYSGSLEYKVVVRGISDTAEDFLTKFSDSDYMEGNVYKSEMKAVDKWVAIDYKGKDKLIKNISNNLKHFNYAPAKAASDIKRITDSSSIQVLVNVKAIMYSLRYKDRIVYLMLQMVSVFTLLATVYLSIDKGNEIEYEYDDDYQEEDIEYVQDSEDDDIDEEECTERRISMRRKRND